MPLIRSKYLYTITGRKRTFHHRFTLNGHCYECDSCRSICDASDCYSQHWTKENLNEKLIITEKQQHQLSIINATDMRVFMVCNAGNDTKEFLLDAGINVVQQLLRLLFTRARQLVVEVTFHVKLQQQHQQQKYLFSSSELMIKHHYDIAESVDMIFIMLLEKIQSTVSTCKDTYDTDAYAVTHIRVDIQSIGTLCDGNLSLPLQYRVKKACIVELDQQQASLEMLEKKNSSKTGSVDSSPLQSINESAETQHVDLLKAANVTTTQETVDIVSISEAYRQHLSDNVTMPFKQQANLYAFKVCRDSRELFAVPQHFISDMKELSQQPMPSYIILSDVQGNFRQLVAISNLRRFLKPTVEDGVLTCRKCEARFMERTKLKLHKMLRCGSEFKISIIDSDIMEINKCWLLMDMGVVSSNKCEVYGVNEL